jgi:hypothetical protein
MTMEITVIGPNSGPIGGGTPVDIKVELEGLDQDTLAFLAVNFGQLAATDVEVKGYDEKNPNEGTITATSPPGKAGTVDITVITPGGDYEATAQNAFTYTAAVLTSVEPDKGSFGVLVLIKGSGFIDVKSVKFGDQSAVFLSVSSSQICALVPTPPGNGSPGSVSVLVEAKGGIAKKDNAFTYKPRRQQVQADTQRRS